MKRSMEHTERVKKVFTWSSYFLPISYLTMPTLSAFSRAELLNYLDGLDIDPSLRERMKAKLRTLPIVSQIPVPLYTSVNLR